MTDRTITDHDDPSDDDFEPTVADGLFAIAHSVNRLADAVETSSGLFALARAVDRLGNGGAATDFGAIEGLAMQLREGLGAVAEAIADETRRREDAELE